MAVDRKIDTLEGALRDAIERFGSEKVAEAIGKSKDYVNNLSNPNQKNAPQDNPETVQKIKQELD